MTFFQTIGNDLQGKSKIGRIDQRGKIKNKMKFMKNRLRNSNIFDV